MNSFFQSFKTMFPEFMWLAVGVLGFVAAVHATYTHGVDRQTIIFYIIVGVSVVMYIFRRRLRLNNQK